MVRHLEQAFVMLLRENYYNGGQGDWNDFSREHPDITSKCRCEEQNYSMNCIFSETNLEDIYENAPELILCPMAARPKLVFQHVLTWPLPQPDFDDLIARATASTRPLKPYAFILGHAGWSKYISTFLMVPDFPNCCCTNSGPDRTRLVAIFGFVYCRMETIG